MQLSPKTDPDLGHEPDALPTGAGSFTLPGRVGERIGVHYYRPKSVLPGSPILLVIPGAGRNGDDYRNAWLAAARKHNFLIASLTFPEEAFDFAKYNLGGVATTVEFKSASFEQVTPRAVSVRLKDEDWSIGLAPDRSDFIFGHIDAAFDFIKKATGSTRTTYDVFGHSAGGQLLHRMAIFTFDTRADRIVAANSGFYTLLDQDAYFPLGLAGLFGSSEPVIESDWLEIVLARNLTILLGENDNSDAAGGTLLHTPLVDRQGLSRLERGKTFYEHAKRTSQEIDAPFKWTLQTVPDIGHDYIGMSAAAAEYLYGK